MTSPANELQQIAQAKQELSDNERVQFDLQLAALRKNPTTALLFSLFFGAMGVDRFYIGNTGLGVAKLLTLGGVGIWAIVDLFLIQRAARRKNIETMRHIRDSILSSAKLSQNDPTAEEPAPRPPAREPAPPLPAREPVPPPISEGSPPPLPPPAGTAYTSTTANPSKCQDHRPVAGCIADSRDSSRSTTWRIRRQHSQPAAGDE